MSLPTQKRAPSDTLEDYTILICGEKNSGKTSFAAQAPNHFIFEFEPGNAKHLSCVYEDCPDLKTFERWLKEAENDKQPRTLIIDEVQKLYELCLEKLLKEAGVDDPQELGWAKGWKRIAAYFNRYITRLQAIPGGNIYTAHCEYKEVKTRGGGKTEIIAPRIGKEVGRLKDKQLHICGMIMFGKEDGQRDFYLQGNNLIEASCKLLENNFRYEGKSIARFPMGENAEVAWNNFTTAFSNKLSVPDDYYVQYEKTEPNIQQKSSATKKHNVLEDLLPPVKKSAFSFGQ